MEVICKRCSRKYDYDRSKGHQRTFCNSCVVTKRRHRTRKKLIDAFGGCCQVCGYKKSIWALEFHHRDRTDKSFGVSKLGRLTISFDKLFLEAQKCDLLCANCHAEIEAELHGECIITG